ncbi:MAG: hypothetical protein LBV34_09835 [Nocardiopsaceae bacterium]|nr:hypothetical protein [Nocardiopsaceae bacterium]
MYVLSFTGEALGITGLALCAFVAVITVRELVTGKPVFRTPSRPGRRPATWSALCLCLGSCILDLTIVTGWGTADPAATLFIARPAVVILYGLSFMFAARSRQQRADSPPEYGA